MNTTESQLVNAEQLYAKKFKYGGNVQISKKIIKTDKTDFYQQSLAEFQYAI